MGSRKTIHNRRKQKKTIQKQFQHSDEMFGYSDVTPMAQETPRKFQSRPKSIAGYNIENTTVQKR